MPIWAKKKGGPMDGEEKELELTPEEKAEEEQALAGVEESSLREELSEKLGIDPDAEGELLDKLVERETAQREKLSGAIKQKIKWREKAGASSQKGGQKPTGDANNGELDIEAKIAQGVNKVLEDRDLRELNLPEEVETEVKKIAKIEGISIREAAKSDYIQFKIEKIEREKRVRSATPGRSNKGSFKPSIDPSKPLNAEDFDLKTEEGRKAWKQAKEARRKFRNSQ